jgi:hypothetical protein
MWQVHADKMQCSFECVWIHKASYFCWYWRFCSSVSLLVNILGGSIYPFVNRNYMITQVLGINCTEERMTGLGTYSICGKDACLKSLLLVVPYVTF